MWGLLGKFFYQWERFKNKCLMSYTISQFNQSGGGIYISPRCVFTPSTISLGSNVYFGGGCVIQSMHGKITIGNHVMFGPGVHIHGGNHITNKVGVYMDQVKKEPGSDPEITIEDDVGIGANAIILSGVHVGQGAVIGAGSIVTNDVPPYEIWVGNPAKRIKNSFSQEEYQEHVAQIPLSNN